MHHVKNSSLTFRTDGVKNDPNAQGALMRPPYLGRFTTVTTHNSANPKLSKIGKQLSNVRVKITNKKYIDVFSNVVVSDIFPTD